MKLCAVALDYDGTIARDGRVEPLVLEAVKEAQARGIVMILVTGRIMADLWRVLPSTSYSMRSFARTERYWRFQRCRAGC
jgi:hydroxymethylpyrimidine pyrophosphatase-like HAD family hydrolase